jgi:hypothetical protein
MPDNPVIAAVEDAPWSADALERLGQLQAVKDLIDYMIERDVGECRTTARRDEVEGPDGSPADNLHRPIAWSTIGEKLGISRQTAHERYRHVEAD